MLGLNQRRHLKVEPLLLKPLQTLQFTRFPELTEDEVARLLGVTHFAEEEVDKHGPIPNTDEGTANETLCRSGGGRAPDKRGILLLEFRFEIYMTK